MKIFLSQFYEISMPLLIPALHQWQQVPKCTITWICNQFPLDLFSRLEFQWQAVGLKKAVCLGNMGHLNRKMCPNAAEIIRNTGYILRNFKLE